jgi:hypothetical protein
MYFEIMKFCIICIFFLCRMMWGRMNSLFCHKHFQFAIFSFSFLFFSFYQSSIALYLNHGSNLG